MQCSASRCAALVRLASHGTDAATHKAPVGRAPRARARGARRVGPGGSARTAHAQDEWGPSLTSISFYNKTLPCARAPFQCTLCSACACFHRHKQKSGHQAGALRATYRVVMCPFVCGSVCISAQYVRCGGARASRTEICIQPCKMPPKTALKRF